MVRTIASDAFGEILETGKSALSQAGQIPRQVVQSAGQQISGKKASGTTEGQQAGVKYSGPEPNITDILPKLVPEEKRKQLEQQDILRRQRGLDSTRSELKAMQIRRYQELQQKIAQEEQKKGEIPISEQAQGGYRTLEEKVKWMEEQKKKEAEKKKKGGEAGSILPQSASNMPGLPGLKRKQTQVETKWGTVG